MIRFATIGTNFIVDWFLRDSAPVKELLHTAVYSRSGDTAAAFAEKHGVKKTFVSLDALAADKEIDAVYIASPNSLHCEQAVKMLCAKKHVLCEKPIACGSGEYERMRRAAEENGALLMEAMRSVYDPAFLKLRELLPRLGRIRRVSFEYCQYSSRYDRFKNGIITNAFDPRFKGGSLMDIGVYCVYPLVLLFGMPESIHAEAVMLKNGLDGAGTVLAYYKEGIQAELSYSKIAEGYRESQIQGENGTLTMDSIHNPYRITLYERGREPERFTFDKPAWNMQYEAQVFADSIINGKTGAAGVSGMAVEFMDTVRERIGLKFPGE